MPDNRVTIRLSDELLNAVDSLRSDLVMTRPEFVRYCVQSKVATFKAVSTRDDVSSSLDVIDALKERIDQLIKENDRIRGL